MKRVQSKWRSKCGLYDDICTYSTWWKDVGPTSLLIIHMAVASFSLELQHLEYNEREMLSVDTWPAPHKSRVSLTVRQISIWMCIHKLNKILSHCCHIALVPVYIPDTLSWSQQDPKERMGCQVQTGFTDIKSHTFFRNIDWEQVRAHCCCSVDLYENCKISYCICLLYTYITFSTFCTFHDENEQGGSTLAAT